MASTVINFTIRLGPLVTLAVSGTNCKDISEALDGFEKLNRQIDGMCSELAENIYPEVAEPEGKEEGAKAKK